MKTEIIENNISQTERRWAVAAHLSAFLGFVVPFASILAPLIILWLEGRHFEYVKRNAKEALNFNITFSLYTLVSLVFLFIPLIGPFIVLMICAVWIFCILRATYFTSKDVAYRYPFTIRFVR